MIHDLLNDIAELECSADETKLVNIEARIDRSQSDVENAHSDGHIAHLPSLLARDEVLDLTNDSEGEDVDDELRAIGILDL
jgi:hypothetical protein